MTSTVDHATDAAFFGAVPSQDGVRFRVWASGAAQRRAAAPRRRRRGRASARADTATGSSRPGSQGAAAGDRYTYVLDGERPLPDPASRFQPDGVHGPSQVVDPGAFAWTRHALALAPAA